MLLNGPESFTPDGNFILGEAPELRNFFVAAGFNSAGIANSGGAGRLIAEWIVGGEPAERSRRTSTSAASAPFTREQQGARRAHRRDARPALRDALAAPGARDCAAAAHDRRSTTCSPPAARCSAARTAGSARTTFAPRRRAAPYRHTLGKPGWLPTSSASSARRGRAVALYDQTSFGKLCCKAAMRSRVLQRLCANEIDVPPGRMVYTRDAQRPRRLRKRPHRHPARADRFLVVTGSAQATRDLDWIARAHRADEARDAHRRQRDDVRALADGAERARPCSAGSARRRPRRARPRALTFATTREIDLGFARVRAARMSYVGGPGYELYVPIEMARHVHLALHARRSSAPTARPRQCRLLRARRAAHRGRPACLGRRARADDTPFEAGLAFAVKLDKPTTSSARRRCERARRTARKKLVDDRLRLRRRYAWGGETLLLDGHPVGEIASAGWSAAAGRCLGLAYVRGAELPSLAASPSLTLDLWGTRVPVTACERWQPRSSAHTGAPMIEQHLDIATADGAMNTFVVHPEEGGPFPVVLFYMDAPGKREELHDMARRLAAVGYFVVLPNLYYRRTRDFWLKERTEEAMAEMFEHMARSTARPRVRDTRGDAALRRCASPRPTPSASARSATA